MARPDGIVRSALVVCALAGLMIFLVIVTRKQDPAEPNDSGTSSPVRKSNATRETHNPTEIVVVKPVHADRVRSSDGSLSTQHDFDVLVAALRQARKEKDQTRESEVIQELSVAASEHLDELLRVLRTETCDPGAPPIVDALVALVRSLTGQDRLRALALLPEEAEQLRGLPTDRRFAGDVGKLYGLVMDLSTTDTRLMRGFMGLVARREDDLAVSRRGLFAAVGGLRVRDYLLPLRAIVMDAAERFEDRVAAIRALIQIDDSEGLAVIGESMQTLRDPNKRADYFDLAAEATDFRNAYAQMRSFFNGPTSDRDLFVQFCIRIARLHSRRDPGGVLTLFVTEARREIGSDPQLAGDLLQALGSPSAPGLAQALSENVSVRQELRKLAEDERASAAFVADCAAGAWAKSSRDPEEVLAALSVWKDKPAAFRGALSGGIWSIGYVSDEVAREKLRARFTDVVRASLDTSGANDDIDAALSACRTGKMIELTHEIQAVAGSSRVEQIVRDKAREILKQFADAAAGK